MPDGKVRLAMPVRVVTARETRMGCGPERDLVATGAGLLLAVGEGVQRGLRGGGEGTDGGEDRHVLVRGAAGAAEMGEAEAVQMVVGVGVAAARLHGVGTGVRAPLDGAEGEVGAGELAHGARADRTGAGAVEGMDEGGRVGDGGGGRRARRGVGGDGRKEEGAGEQSGQRDRRHPNVAPASGLSCQGHTRLVRGAGEPARREAAARDQMAESAWAAATADMVGA